MSEDHVSATLSQLSERELEILRLVATGLSNKEIAAQLVLSPNTVKVHLRNIFGKIGVASRTEATMYAVRQGWVEVPAEVRAEAEADDQATEPDVQTESEAVTLPESAVETALPSPQPRTMPEPPLPWLQRIALILATVLVVAGVIVTWPRVTAANGSPRSEFSDLPGQNVAALTSDGETRWQAVAPMPTSRGRLALATMRSKLYAVGGMTAGGVTGAMEIFDPAKGAWSAGAAKLTPVANISAVALNDKLIVPGGFTANGTAADIVEIYDPDADAWSSGVALPEPVFAYALAASGGKAYLFGGTNGRSYLNHVWMYDPAADRWTARAPMPTPRGFAAAAILNGDIYVVGGYDGQREFATCERYSPDRDTWQTCAPLAVGRGGLGLASIAGRLYAVGGGWSGYLAFGEKYDPVANVWSPIETPLAGEWRNLAVTTYRGADLYAVGGWNGQSYLAITEKYSPFPFQIFFSVP